MAVKKKAAKKKATTKKKVAAKKKSSTPKKKAKTKSKAKTAVKKKAASAKKKAAAPKKKAAKKTAAKKTAKAAPKAAKPKVKAKAKAKVKPALGEDLGLSEFTPYEMKKGEEYMNEAQAAHFRGLLNSWKRELMSKVDETVHHMQDEAANFPDPNDRASQESEFTMELRTRDRERKLIKKIEESLVAIDNEEYGYCTSCGIEIGIRRLEARPTATECIDCKTLNEIKEKQYNV
jgi:DnaK suppressor protein